MTLAFDHEKTPPAEVAKLFASCAGILAFASAAFIAPGMLDRNASAAVQEIVGKQNMNSAQTRLSQEFIAAVSARIFPRLNARNLPRHDRDNLLVHDALVFHLDAMDGNQATIPFAVTSAFPNSTNQYYTVQNTAGQTTLVQCNVRQWLRVQTDSFLVSNTPATIAEIANDCHVVGAGTNPWQGNIERSNSIYNAPPGLRSEVAQALVPAIHAGSFPETAMRIQLQLSTFGPATADTVALHHHATQLRLFMNGKFHVCDATSTGIGSVSLPGRRLIEDSADGFRRRNLVDIRSCG